VEVLDVLPYRKKETRRRRRWAVATRKRNGPQVLDWAASVDGKEIERWAGRKRAARLELGVRFYFPKKKVLGFIFF
jgi:hypothetical protein